MAGLVSFFNPKSVAIIGASKAAGKIGNVIVKNMISSGYTGPIFPINPKEQEIEGLACYPAVDKTPMPAELAVLSLPASRTLDAAQQCGISGVKNLVVITAGFKETGKEGLELERRLVETCRKYEMRMTGPNCVGLIDTHTPINASFAAGFPLKGEIAFISQSGAMVLSILDWSYRAGLGFSKFVSLGNKADLTESHFIEDAGQDPNTKVILCYIEDVENGAHFLEAARTASRKKPVIILKSGTSQAGAQAASSHTGALAGSDLAYETAFRQCGVIRARSMAELFDLAVAFASQPVPSGGRVAVVTNSGGPGIIAADTIEQKKLQMARFTQETIEQLRGNLPRESNIYNPVDVLGDAKADRFRFSLDKALSDPGVDSALVLVCPTAVTEPVETARALVEMRAAHPEKPLLAAYMGGEKLAEGVKVLEEAKIPCFTFPEPAVSSISGLTGYARTRELPANEQDLSYECSNLKNVKAILYDVRKDKRLVLLGSEAAEVVEAYGIPAAPTTLAASPGEAAESAGRLGYPVVLKIASPEILHKSDVGGVLIGLDSPERVRAGFLEIMNNVHRYLPNAAVYGVEVQKMMPKGTELIIGMSKDIQFGPLIAFGLGGIYVNLLKDVSFRLASGLNRGEIENMLAETKAYTLLRGYRGEKPADIEAIIGIIGRVARLVTDFPEITEMDINPVFAYNQGACALDVKITVS
ncbi:succinyl-CoA synthetase subunit alpha [Pelotomaculum schinkii]|uniref:Succinyl-CoA synthetase subunit alpha n=1 Tax=Pelotomaculum schinkii TaxID=78350 RepID=A0A4Y7R9R9_9FIRM|nr:acetate--CoA ligase [Pelotomaculum schinkii]TEB05526.1 succinyl-CoA synthetase subunit alpha [Pelotomaculum schinkii]